VSRAADQPSRTQQNDEPALRGRGRVARADLRAASSTLPRLGPASHCVPEQYFSVAPLVLEQPIASTLVVLEGEAGEYVNAPS
jgi:hypothetical protein